MKIFGFITNNEKKFIYITCNIIIAFIVVFVFSLSVFSPLATTAYINSPPAFYRGNSDKNNISLMFNVYWGTEYLDSILKTLDNNDVKATFFVGGYWLAKNNEMLIKIFNNGHEIGNHGYNHKDHAKISDEQNQNEIYMTGELVEAVCGIKMNLFAPPSGSYNEKVLKIADSLGYKTIMWSKDTIDWRDKNADLIFSRATNNSSNGDLILMHPTEKTAEVLDRIIKNLKQKGFNLVSVSENLS